MINKLLSFYICMRNNELSMLRVFRYSFKHLFDLKQNIETAIKVIKEAIDLQTKHNLSSIHALHNKQIGCHKIL